MSKFKTKTITALLCIVLSLAIFIVGIIGGILILLNSDSYFESQFEKNNVSENTGISSADLTEINSAVRDFLLNERDELVVYANRKGENKLVFKEKEQAHMLDVKNLLNTFLPINYVCIATLLALACFGFFKSNKTILKALKYSSVGALIVPIIFIMFFDEMFIMFHEIFFPNGNWTFSLRASIMINIYTEAFFLNFCINLGVILVILCAVIFIASSHKIKKTERGEINCQV